MEQAWCRLPTDGFRESVPLSTHERCQRDGGDADVDDTGHEKSQGHRCRFVSVLQFGAVGYCFL